MKMKVPKFYQAKKLSVLDEGFCLEFETEQQAIDFYWHSQEKGVNARREEKKVIFQLKPRKVNREDWVQYFVGFGYRVSLRGGGYVAINLCAHWVNPPPKQSPRPVWEEERFGVVCEIASGGSEAE